MFGKNRHRISYYACQIDPNEHRDRPWFRDHPKSLWAREDVLITPVSRFFAAHVFVPDRRSHLKAALEAARVAEGRGDRPRRNAPRWSTPSRPSASAGPGWNRPRTFPRDKKPSALHAL
ncbi:hypothetical protein [Streptomyces hygroscopicus]|uniref:hypothetical protein n=1 Tax=Streptomyces hygroscopicus TaxID=1912 RepID=UPI0013314CCD|nr:hypothetical protein [Streptomyces hygroscopicus]MBW8087494.1 hypothetical protein [Streptomyces hygroscopicus subsp. hygroscopicus]